MSDQLPSRFALLHELGHGASSRVFAVRDRALDAHRALKLATGKNSKRRMRLEYVGLSELRHPNVVRAYDYGITSGGYAYYTMELVRGTNLGAFAARQDPDILGSLAMQILDAMATLHARGFVHRDITPKNILVVGEPAAALVRLIDLGLCAKIGEQVKAGGTLPYVAPEVARGEVVDGRADLFSLGAVLYEALVPEQAARTLEQVAERMATEPPAPSFIDPTIPRGFSDFIMTLLAPDATQRFANAEAAAEALARITALRLGRGPARAMAERLLRGGAVSHRTALVKRVMKEASRCMRGAGSLMALDGPAGIGKTPLLRELAMRLNLRGLRVLQLRTGVEPGAPLATLQRAAQALGSGIQLTPVESLASTRRGAQLQRFVARAAAVLARSLGEVPTVLLIDDVHRAEHIGLEVLRALAHQAAQVPLLLICAGDPRADGRSLGQLLGPECVDLEVGPLRVAEVGRLAAHRLWGLRLPKPALERLVYDSGGMPSLVERTLARLLVDGTVQRSGASFVFAGGRYRAARHGDTELIADRIARVRPEQRQVLWAAAVLAHGLDSERVGRIAGVSRVRAARVLAELARSEILDPTEATLQPVYKFASRSLLAAVYQAVPVAERRTFHDRAALLLTEVPREEGRLEARVEHLLRGSDDALAVEEAMAAGDRASAVYADRRAIEYYARAYARLSAHQKAKAGPLALRLGRLFERIGEPERALSWYGAAAEAAASTPDAELELEATLGLGGVYLLKGGVAEAHRQAERAAALLGRSKSSRLRAAAERLQALVAVQAGHTERAAALFLAALQDLEKSGAPAQIVEVLLDLARVARQRGELSKAVRYARRALLYARRAGDSAAVAEACCVLGRGFLRAARFGAAKRALLHGLKVARAAGDRLRLAALQREIGNLLLRMGRLDKAIGRYGRALELSRTVRARVDESACLHNIGVVRSRLGELQPALLALRAALEVASDIGDSQGAAYTAVELGHTYLQVGDVQAAVAVLEEAEQRGQALGDIVVQTEGRALFAYAELLRGEQAPAEAVVQFVFDRVDSIEDPGNRSLALLYAGRASLALGFGDAARRAAERLTQEVTHFGLRDVSAAASGLLGQALLLLGEAEAGRAKLADAAQLAARMRLVPLEIELRGALGQSLAGSEAGARELTRAMELMREVARALPEALQGHYLRRREAQDLRRAFARERERIVGVLGGPSA